MEMAPLIATTPARMAGIPRAHAVPVVEERPTMAADQETQALIQCADAAVPGARAPVVPVADTAT
jgi:hypothetical protein